ncbi:hypothetical protein Mapa_014894 [Marchantia paleacea]|nr:hypothetical protein Mapa_014894 [Marchantia paleacea]
MSKGLRNPPTSPTKSTFSAAVAMSPYTPCQLSLRLFFRAPVMYTIRLHLESDTPFSVRLGPNQEIFSMHTLPATKPSCMTRGRHCR